MVLSSTYQQESRVAASETAKKEDPDNHLLWRMNRQRLTGEAIRDAMLAVAGQSPQRRRLINLAYALEAGPVRVVPRVGLGGIVPHPETVVRGLAWGIDGDPRWFHWGGLGGQLAVGLEAPWIVAPSLEGKLTLGFSRIRIAQGYVEGWFRSLHGTFGLGWP